MKVYISGKITDLTKRQREANFYYSKIKLINDHCIDYDKIINPLRIPPFLGIDNWYCHMISDLLVMVLFCRTIALQPNWEESRGARIEKRVADFLKFKVIKL